MANMGAAWSFRPNPAVIQNIHDVDEISAESSKSARKRAARKKDDISESESSSILVHVLKNKPKSAMEMLMVTLPHVSSYVGQLDDVSSDNLIEKAKQLKRKRSNLIEDSGSWPVTTHESSDNSISKDKVTVHEAANKKKFLDRPKEAKPDKNTDSEPAADKKDQITQEIGGGRTTRGRETS